MLDIKYIRENKKEVKKVCELKKRKVDIDLLLSLDEERRIIQSKIDELGAKRNELAGGAKVKPSKEQIEAGKKLKQQLGEKEAALKGVEQQFNQILMAVPNITSSDTPVGKDESENKVLRKVGKPVKFKFEPKDHMELGESLGLIDTEKSAAIAGARFNYLFGDAVLLQFAVLNFVLATLTDEKIIGDIFDRINRNVIKLRPQELRHAKFDGIFITIVEDLTNWMFNYLSPDGKSETFPNIDTRSKKQMKDVEMVAELLIFLEEGVKALNQDYLDKAFSEKDVEWENKSEIEQEFRNTVEHIKEILNLSQNLKLHQTRLRNQADFYSFFGAIAELNRENNLPITKIIGQRIYDFLQVVTNEDERENNETAKEYYKSVRFSFTDIGARRNRIDIMKSIIKG